MSILTSAANKVRAVTSKAVNTASNNGTTDSASSGGGTITISGKPSAGKCCAKANGGTQPPYQTVTRSYRNYCPNCKKSNVLKSNPKGVAEGEITCGACDSDFCICCGYDKNGTCRSRLTPADGAVPTSNDNTAKNVLVNDPVKNKLLSEVRMSEELRETLEITFRIPRILKGLRTNSWFFIDVADGFYEENYGTLMSVIADKKFGRYAGFQEGRFFVEKIVEKGGVDGVSMEITVNPLATNYGQYIKMQMEAEKALIEALNEKSGGGGGSAGSPVNVSGNDCNPSDGLESHHWAGHKCNPPKCTSVSKTIHGNSNRQYAKDTAAHNSNSKELVEYVRSQCQYQYYGDNPHGEERCPERMWTGKRPIRGNCADYARMLKCILDVNGYQSIICHIPGHFYNAIWENGGWTVCDLCHSPAYGYANHGSIKPKGTWDNPIG